MGCVSCINRKREYMELLMLPEIDTKDKLVNIFVRSIDGLAKPDKTMIRSIDLPNFTNVIKMYLAKKFFISVFINKDDPELKKIKHVSEITFKLPTTVF